MTSVRLLLKDHQWERMRPHLPGKPSDPGRTGVNNRLFVEAVLWLAGQVFPGAICQTFLVIGTAPSSAFPGDPRMAADGVWDRLFAAMADDPDFEYIMIDSTIVRVHQPAVGKKGGLKLVRSAVRGAA